MTTAASEIIDAAYLKIGVDSATDAQDASALVNLNNMVGSWSVEFYSAVDVSTTNYDAIGSITTTVGLPSKMNETMVYNLALTLGEDFDRVIKESTLARAKELKALFASEGLIKIVPQVDYKVKLGNQE